MDILSSIFSVPYLKEADHEAICHELCVRIGAILQQGKDTPEQLHARDQPVHRQTRKQIRKRDLADDLGDLTDGLEVDELVPMELEVVGKPGHPRIVCRLCQLFCSNKAMRLRLLMFEASM